MLINEVTVVFDKNVLIYAVANALFLDCTELFLHSDVYFCIIAFVDLFHVERKDKIGDFMKKAVKVFFLVVVILLLTVGGYFAYVFISYDRIEDKQKLAIDSVSTAVVPANQELKAASFNIGYGSYPPDYSFFMDGGEESVARSADSVKECINGVGKTMQDFDADFLFFQEVDTDSDRSLHINEESMLRNRFSSYNEHFAVNYHSAFLFYPITQPIGKSNSGIMQLSKYTMESAERRSLPISTSFSKFIDLDRCYTVSDLPVDNGKTLYLYNVHLTAYGSTESISVAQITMLSKDISSKLAGGDYVICGGDFNHDFTGDSVAQLNTDGKTFAWCQPFPTELLPENVKCCIDYEGELVPTSRNMDCPYDPEASFTVVLDGFIVSDNIEVLKVENIDEGFQYSDHNPVTLDFKLK